MPGRNEEKGNVIRAHDLIYGFLEFQGLSPDRLNCTTSALRENPPRLIRYQRLIAMLAAFGIKSDLVSFETREFS